jgi:hypothetical protein
MDVGEAAPLLGVYKPRRGEAPLWDFPEGTLYKREYASFLLSEALGWQLVPPTVIRKGPNGTGTVQNTDRKAGHCLRGADGHIWGIDHGLTFHPHPKLRTVIWDFGGEPIPPDLLADIRRVYKELKAQQKMMRKLNEVLMAVEMEALGDRLQHVLEHPEFPSLQRRRSVPWSFY